MITYTFIFAELPDGTFKIHWGSPPSNATAKEQIFAKNFSGLCRKIFEEIKQQTDGVIITENWYMEFSNGVKAMARNVIPAIQLVHKGIWTLGDMEDWLNAVINDTEENPGLRSKAWLQLMRQNTHFPTY